MTLSRLDGARGAVRELGSFDGDAHLADRAYDRSSSRSATPSNPMRSTGGPRITGFRDLASSSAGPSIPSSGDDDDDDDDDEGRDPTHFFAGGAKR